MAAPSPLRGTGATAILDLGDASARWRISNRRAAASSDGTIEAPGQLASHYAPAKPLRIDAESAEPDEFWIGFGSVRGDSSLSPAGDLREAAARLFDLLHRADASPKPRIAVAPVPSGGLGDAINDRLKRAAARP